jgi:hypothetical protein
MTYQPKTTMMAITVGKWDENTTCSLRGRMSAAHAIANLVAARCEMDIISFSPYSTKENECEATVVFINNGRSLCEIVDTMKPEINDHPDNRYWMILDMDIWQGLIDCFASTKDHNQEWS